MTDATTPYHPLDAVHTGRIRAGIAAASVLVRKLWFLRCRSQHVTRLAILAFSTTPCLWPKRWSWELHW